MRMNWKATLAASLIEFFSVISILLIILAVIDNDVLSFIIGIIGYIFFTELLIDYVGKNGYRSGLFILFFRRRVKSGK